jgi:hypothetical protein
MNRIPIVAVLALLAAPPWAAANDAATPAPAAQVASSAAPGKAHDRLELDSTSITGNRELPKVMSIVPWKDAEPPAGPDRPMNSLVDELLAPIDRDEFRREIGYYRDLTRPAPAAASLSTPTSPGAKEP